jgi:hypothetical protein
MGHVLGVIAYGFGTIIAFAVIVALIYLFVKDVTQKQHTILRNFPVVGHLRYYFEELGEYSASISSWATAKKCRLIAPPAAGCTA